MIAELDYFREKEITCPHCGWKDRDSWEFEKSGEKECGNCERTFYVEREVDVTYTSVPID
jgi:sarcosine oxidase delta subunit